MASEQASERMTDEQIKARVLAFYPEVKAWVDGGGQPWTPAAGSALAADDAVCHGMSVSHLARMSLAIGSEHLATAAVYSVNFGPPLFTMQTVLRTALIGGAQAVWLLSPDDQSTRVDRANQLSRDAYWNQLMWAKLITTTDPDVVDQQELATVRETLSKITAGKRSTEVKLGPVVRTAAEYVYSKPPDPDLHNECVAEFRHLSGTAHALPWTLNTRAEKMDISTDGQVGTLHLPSWAQLQAALSESYAYLHTGWRLLTERSAAAKG